MDNGKPIWEARADLESVISSLEYYGGLAPAIVGYQVQRPGRCELSSQSQYPNPLLQVRLPGGSWGHASREPLGVVGGVGAWNYPLQTCTWKVLGTGCTVLHCTVLYCTAGGPRPRLRQHLRVQALAARPAGAGGAGGGAGPGRGARGGLQRRAGHTSQQQYP